MSTLILELIGLYVNNNNNNNNDSNNKNSNNNNNNNNIDNNSNNDDNNNDNNNNNKNSVTHFDSFGVEHIPKEIKEFIDSSLSITTNFF